VDDLDLIRRIGETVQPQGDAQSKAAARLTERIDAGAAGSPARLAGLRPAIPILVAAALLAMVGVALVSGLRPAPTGGPAQVERTATTEHSLPNVKSAYRVAVQNASGRNSVAQHFTEIVQDAGYQIRPPTSSRRSAVRSYVAYRAGMELLAREVATDLSIDRVVSADDAGVDADIAGLGVDALVVIGADRADEGSDGTRPAADGRAVIGETEISTHRQVGQPGLRCVRVTGPAFRAEPGGVTGTCTDARLVESEGLVATYQHGNGPIVLYGLLPRQARAAAVASRPLTVGGDGLFVAVDLPRGEAITVTFDGPGFRTTRTVPAR